MAKIKQLYLNDINNLYSRNSTRRGKYRRNLRVYLHTYGFDMERMDSSVAGYYVDGSDYETDTSSGIQENIVKSCIDTLSSKMAAQKVRPFFNTVNGSFKDMQIVRQGQQFFDQYFDEQNVNKTVTNAFRDSCIFDMGAVYIDSYTHSIQRVMPWQISFDPREMSYGNVMRVLWTLKDYPVSLLPDDRKLRGLIGDNSYDQGVTYHRYYNIKEHVLVHYIEELDFAYTEKWDREVIPFIFIWYDHPIKSGTSNSIVDLLYGIQSEVDILVEKIKDASQITAPVQYFVPEQSNIKVSKLSNRTGEIITYTMAPNQTTPPIVQNTLPFMDPQWVSTLEKFKQDAYELCGISQLSAMSQKPQGLNSGVALSTMEDIESSRFEIQLNQVIKMYVDIAKMCIELFDPNDDILPPNGLRLTVKWADIVRAREQLSIQFSAAEHLSKDPQTRSQQVMMLVQMGAIPQSRVASLMEIPDLGQGYSLANSSINAVMAIIDDCIENGNMQVPDYIPTQMLLEEILNTCLSLRGSNNPDNDESINRLLALYETVTAKEQNSQTSAEMMAVQTLTNEIMADLQNPKGQINSQVLEAVNDHFQEQNMANNKGE